MSDYVNEHVESCSKRNLNLTYYWITEFYGLWSQLEKLKLSLLTVCLEIFGKTHFFE